MRQHTDLRWNELDRPVTREKLLEQVADVEGLLCLVTDRIDAAVMDAAPGLKAIANYAVGYDNIDVTAASQRGIVVTNTPDVLTAATADMAMALLLAAARRILEGDRLVRGGDWEGWAPQQLLGRELSGATLGIVGMGRIGRAVAKRASGFGLRLLYWNRTRLDGDQERELLLRYVSLEELLNTADFVSLHVAYGPATHHLIGPAELDRMKPGSFLVNTARGAVVDERALLRALESGHLAGAGLDVFEREPKVERGLLKLDNVVLTPHLGSATRETRAAMGMIAARNLLAALRRETPPNAVNADALRARH